MQKEKDMVPNKCTFSLRTFDGLSSLPKSQNNTANARYEAPQTKLVESFRLSPSTKGLDLFERGILLRFGAGHSIISRSTTFLCFVEQPNIVFIMGN